MTSKEGVSREVFNMIRKLTPVGQPVSKTMIKRAYDIVRNIAIRDTIAWKQNFMTIERS